MLPTDEVSHAAENEGAKRPHHEPGGEGRKGAQERGRGVAFREELYGEDGGK